MGFVHQLMRPGATCAIAIGAAIFAAAGSASAATFSYVYAGGAASYSAAAGATLAVPIYINETSANAFDPSLINDQAGLTGAAFSVTKSGTSTIASVTGNPGTPAAGGFNGPIAVVGATVSETEADSSTGALAQFVAAGNYYRVRLGTVNVKVGTAGTTTTFTVGPLAGDETVTNTDSYNLDVTDAPTLYESAAATSFRVVAAAVAPEPTSAATVATAMIVALSNRRPRRGRA